MAENINNNNNIEKLKAKLKEEELLLEIQKAKWERKKYETEKAEPAELKEINYLQRQLKKERLQYQMDKLKKSWNWPYFLIIVAFFLVLVMFLFCSRYFLPAFEMKNSDYVQIMVNKIWANVFILFFKTMIIAIVLYFMYQISNKWLEKSD